MIMPILAVSDLAASLNFYRDVLGMTNTFTMPGEDGQPTFAIVQLSDHAMVGLSKDDAPAPKGTGVVFMAYVAAEADIDAYYNDCLSRGLKPERAIEDMYWGDRAFQVKDPDGYVFELCKTVNQEAMDNLVSNSSS